MSVKRLRPESVVGPVPQGPRDMVKAGLLEPQFPVGVRFRPPVGRLQPGAAHCTGTVAGLMHLRWVDVDQYGQFKGTNGAPKSR